MAGQVRSVAASLAPRVTQSLAVPPAGGAMLHTYRGHVHTRSDHRVRSSSYDLNKMAHISVIHSHQHRDMRDKFNSNAFSCKPPEVYDCGMVHVSRLTLMELFYTSQHGYSAD